MVLTPSMTLLSVQSLIAVAVALQTIEHLMARHAWSESGAWRWSHIREEFTKLPGFSVLDSLLSHPMFSLVLIARLVFSVLALFSPHPVWPLSLLITTVLISIRWRGSFNGGSDAMTIVILTALSVARFFPGSEAIQQGTIWYIAVQAGLSYFVAGWSKIGKASWRSGQALPAIFQTSAYTASPGMNWIIGHPLVCFSMAWTVLIFECTFPVAFLSPTLCLFYLGFALVFHLTNVYILGLNRFVFAWVASYPALYYCSSMFK